MAREGLTSWKSNCHICDLLDLPQSRLGFPNVLTFSSSQASLAALSPKPQPPQPHRRNVHPRSCRIVEINTHITIYTHSPMVNRYVFPSYLSIPRPWIIVISSAFSFATRSHFFIILLHARTHARPTCSSSRLGSRQSVALWRGIYNK
jgi:hypothetical protein